MAQPEWKSYLSISLLTLSSSGIFMVLPSAFQVDILNTGNLSTPARHLRSLFDQVGSNLHAVGSAHILEEIPQQQPQQQVANPNEKLHLPVYYESEERLLLEIQDKPECHCPPAKQRCFADFAGTHFGFRVRAERPAFYNWRLFFSDLLGQPADSASFADNGFLGWKFCNSRKALEEVQTAGNAAAEPTGRDEFGEVLGAEGDPSEQHDQLRDLAVLTKLGSVLRLFQAVRHVHCLEHGTAGESRVLQFDWTTHLWQLPDLGRRSLELAVVQLVLRNLRGHGLQVSGQHLHRNDEDGRSPLKFT